jgi:SAM-dependent methyltransferase
MLRLARSRVQCLGLCAAVSLELMPIECLAEIRDPGPFDGIYSNFGAFNCIADPGAVSGELARLLRPGGKLVMCLLGRFCLWETAWFVLQGGMRKGFRRFSGMAEGSVGSPGSSPSFRLYYPSISDLRRMLAEHFSLLAFRSIGALVPPSYAENWARRHPRMLDGLAALDFHAGRLPVLRATGDHRLAIFARRGN